jgi:DNA-binding winged helix-turn-helix (wHTH) protein/TolB-like protein/Tfp pilus assembly protein PilF
MGALQFEGFALDVSRPVLMRNGRKIPLRPQALKVLVYLAEQRERVVSTDELVKNCWEEAKQKDTHANSVAQCIKEIREALGKTKHEVIRTVPRQGYLFAAPVSAVEAALPQPAVRAVSKASAPDAASVGAPWLRLLQQRWQISAAGAVLAAMLIAGGWAFWSWGRPTELTMTHLPSLVVLPVKPLGDQADTALATLADEIAAALWRAPRGFNPVIQPTTAVKDAQDDPKVIGRNLGVRYLVRNLARREGEQIHVTVQLVEARSARQVWARDFAFRPGEPKAQSRLAARIGQTLAAEILRAEVLRPLPARLEAGHFVMLGRKLLTDEDNAKGNAGAIAYFEKALAADRKHFLALVHYARAIARHRIIGWMPESEAGEKVAKAEEAIDLALSIEPNAAGAHLTRANLLRAKSEYGPAIDAFWVALKLDENFFPARAELARTLIDAGRAEEAIPLLKEAIEATPTDINPHFWYFWMGLAALHLPDRNADALEWFARAYAHNRKHDNTLKLWAVALADAGRHEEALKKLHDFLKLRENATLDDGSGAHLRLPPEVAKVRKHIRDTLKQLGVPEGKAKAASKN